MGQTTQNIILVFIGGGVGSVFRYLAGLWVLRLFPDSWPLNTWLVNILGSLLIGILFGLISVDARWGEITKIFLIIGFCGGFTTFSSFSYENLILLQEGEFLRFILYAMSSLIVGILMVYLGYRLGGQA